MERTARAGCAVLLAFVAVGWTWADEPADSASAPAVVADAQEVAFDTIAGPLPKVVAYPGRPYYVQGDIEVPADRLVTIEPGVVFLFKPFTGLHVQGRVEVKGTRAHPVVFTSVNDRVYSPGSALVANPYDWNGVYVHADALGSEFEHCVVQYSVYGLMSETKFIRVEPGVFRENGKSNLLIDEAEHAKSGEPVSYVLSTKDAVVDGVPVRILDDPMAPRRSVWRYSGIGLFVVGCVLGIYEAVEANRAGDRLAALSSTDDLDNLRYKTSDDWDEARSDRTATSVLSSIGFTLGAAGAFGFGWSFRF